MQNKNTTISNANLIMPSDLNKSISDVEYIQRLYMLKDAYTAKSTTYKQEEITFRRTIIDYLVQTEKAPSDTFAPHYLRSIGVDTKDLNSARLEYGNGSSKEEPKVVSKIKEIVEARSKLREQQVMPKL